jgi:hypothetical protein
MVKMHTDEEHSPKPTLFMAILPIALTVVLLMIQLFVFDDFTPHIPLALGIAITGAIAWKQGYRWAHMEAGIYHVVSVGLPSLAILMTVGMIIGVWILSGTVPLLIDLLWSGHTQSRDLSVCRLPHLRDHFAGDGNFLGHGGNGRSGFVGHWRRAGDPLIPDRRRRCFRGLFR